MAVLRIASSAALVLALAACSSGKGLFRQDAFYPERHAYRVAYAPGQNALLPGDGWVVDNYRTDGAQVGDAKTGPGYETKVRLDADGDGVCETEMVLPAYDLLMRNVRHGGRMWVRTLPIPRHASATELRILALDYIDAVSATGQLAADLGGCRAADYRRKATRVLDSAPAELDGMPAYEITFDVLDVAQVGYADDGRAERTRMVVVRPDFTFRVEEARFPALMLIGYTNRAQEFFRSSREFEGFVAGVDVLSDGELVASVADEIFECEDEDAREVAVVVDIAKNGAVEWADAYQPSDEREPRRNDDVRSCTQRALSGLRFRDTGERRRLTVQLDRDRTELRAGGYHRITPVAKAAHAVKKPAPAPASVAPAPAPAPTPAPAVSPAAATEPQAAPKPAVHGSGALTVR